MARSLCDWAVEFSLRTKQSPHHVNLRCAQLADTDFALMHQDRCWLSLWSLERLHSTALGWSTMHTFKAGGWSSIHRSRTDL